MHLFVCIKLIINQRKIFKDFNRKAPFPQFGRSIAKKSCPYWNMTTAKPKAFQRWSESSEYFQPSVDCQRLLKIFKQLSWFCEYVYIFNSSFGLAVDRRRRNNLYAIFV